MGGRSGTSTTTAYNLPDAAVPFAQNYLAKAYRITTDPAYNSYFDEYAADTYAEFQPVDGHYPEWDGIEALATRGRNGNATVIKGDLFLRNVLDGSYLDCLDADFVEMLDDTTGKPTTTFTNDVLPKLAASCYLIGDLSGENLANTLASSLPSRYSDRVRPIIKDLNYREERQKQTVLSGVAPIYADESIKDAEALHRAGVKYRAWLQGRYQMDFEKWQDAETADLRRTEILGNAIRSLVGSQTTRTEPYHRPSPLMGMMGGAMAGTPLGVPGIAAGAAIGLLASM